MNRKIYGRSLGVLIMVLIAVALTAGPSFAATYELKAGTVVVSMPDATDITMWGFGLLADPEVTVPGPILEVPPGDTSLTIELTNNLPEAVSIVIPGQVATGTPVVVGGRVQSFTHETAGGGGTGTYTWNNLKAGTYIYQSGTHPAKQVQMGLYGAVTVGSYAGVDNEVVLLYSEIDPALHDPAPAVAKPLNYKPEYFLVNGQPYQDGVTVPLSAGDINQTLLIRFLNAGLKTHVPTLLGGYMSVIAEDGNLYPYAKEQYSVLLPAGKTMDALWDPSVPGTYAIYDARHYLTTGGFPYGGMLAYLEVATAAGAPVAVDDSYGVAEDGTLVTTAGGTPAGVLDNDTGGTAPLTAILVYGPSAGTLALNTDGSFTYSPNLNFNGTDQFTYKIRDSSVPPLDSNNVATVTITVTPENDAPVASPDAYDAVVGETLIVAAPGVLGNDIDVDGDPLTAVLDTDVTGGTLALNADGSFSYTPASTAEPGDTDSFTYVANDGTVDSAPATVTINVIAATPNIAPVAVDNVATTTKNTPVDINVVGNDYDPDDPDGIDPATVVIAVDPTRGGTAVANPDGTVTYTPPSGFRGTDVFYYNVKDNLGATSNDAKVTVNVVK